MSNTKIGLGLIGCGMISQAVHMSALADNPNCEVIVACDLRDIGKAVAARHFPGAYLVRDTKQVFANPNVSAVIIALPPSENKTTALAALTSAHDVYIEKPLACTLEEGMEISSAVDTSDQVAMIGFNFRRHHAALAAKRAIDSGEIGEVVSISSQNHTMQPLMEWKENPSAYWRTDPAKGGGALSDLASHHIDFAHLLTDSLTASVNAEIRSRVTSADCAEIQLRMNSGAICQISTLLGSARHVNKLAVTGTKGQFEIDILDPAPATIKIGAPAYTRSGRVKTAVANFAPLAALKAEPGEPSFGASLSAFINACQTRDRAIEPSINDGLNVLKVIDAAYKSAHDGGMPVSLSSLA